MQRFASAHPYRMVGILLALASAISAAMTFAILRP